MADILVVDDDPFARSGLRLYLESLRYRVFEAGDAQTAWELTLAAPPQTAASRANCAVADGLTEVVTSSPLVP